MMASNIRNQIKTLERLSLISCSAEVLTMLERALLNVAPILSANTSTTQPLIWQNKLTMERLHQDQPHNRLAARELKKNAGQFFEDYVAIGPTLKQQAQS